MQLFVLSSKLASIDSYQQLLEARITALEALISSTAHNHNIVRFEPKDVTSYYNDGTLWQRLAGTNGFSKYEDIYAGDYFKMSKGAITCKDSYQGSTGTDYVTIVEIRYCNDGDTPLNKDVLVCVAGKGTTNYKNHFGRHRMNASNTTVGGYWSSEMVQEVLGLPCTTAVATPVTINEKLFNEFGTHLQTSRELVSTSMDATQVAGQLASSAAMQQKGVTDRWDWKSMQATLMSEIEVYGSISFSSSGYDNGNACKQFAAFLQDKRFINNGTSYYWLKNLASATLFCDCNSNGSAYCSFANYADCGVRPRFLLA